MNKLTLYIAAFGLWTCRGVERLVPIHPNCYDFAATANHFIALGEERTVAELNRYWRANATDLLTYLDKRKEIGWVCRLVFVESDRIVTRRPFFGGQGMPFDALLDADWPNYPLVKSDGIFFLLAEGYEVGGMPEDPIRYLQYCRANGKFRKEMLKVPIEAEASRALDHLFDSQLWKGIPWKGSKRPDRCLGLAS